MSSSATGVGMPICFLWAILLILTQKSSQKFGDVLGIISILLNAKVVRIWEIYKFIMVHFAQNLIFLCLFPLFLIISLYFLPYEHNTFNVGEEYRILYIGRL